MNTNIRFAATAARVTTGDAAADALKAAVAKLPEGGIGHFFAPTKTAVEDKSHAKHLANFALWLLAGRPDNMKAPYSSKTLSVAEVVVRDALPNFRLAANAKGQEGVLICPLTLNKDVTQLSEVATQLDKGDWASFAPALRAKVVRALKLKAPAAAWVLTATDRKTPALLVDTPADVKMVKAALKQAEATTPAAADSGTKPKTESGDGRRAKADAAAMTVAARKKASASLTLAGYLTLTDLIDSKDQERIDVAVASALNGPALRASYTGTVNGGASNVIRTKVLDDFKATVKAKRPQLLSRSSPAIDSSLDVSVLIGKEGTKQVPVFVFTNRVRNLGVKGGLAGLKGRAGAAVKRSSSGMLRMAVQLEQEDKDAISKNAESWWRSVTKAVLEIGLFYGGGAILNDGETAVLVVYQA